MSEFTDSLRLHYDERLYEEADNLLCDAANYIDKIESELATLKQELQVLRSSFKDECSDIDNICEKLGLVPSEVEAKAETCWWLKLKITYRKHLMRS